MTSPDPARGYVGMSVDDARLRASQEGRRLRVIKPGDLVTMEYVEGRITITVDGGHVIRATSG